MIRILHVVDNLGRGGLQNGLVNLIQRLDPGCFQHTICTIRHLEHVDAHRFPPERIRVMCAETGAARQRIQLPTLVRLIRQEQPDVVHSRNWAATEAVLAARIVRGCAVIHSEHGLDADTAGHEPWRRSTFRRLVFELSDRVLSVSHHLRDLHTRRTGFPAGSIQVIHNGVDTQRFRPDEAARVRVRAELGIGEDEFCIGSVGNLFPVKDQMTLLRAMVRASAECGRWKLLIAGDGPELEKLRAFADSQEELRTRVVFLGLHSRIPELLNALDVYVLPSLAEGICNSLLEAMAAALPVVATFTGGNPEVAIDNVSGLLFPVTDDARLAAHLIRLRREPKLRGQLGGQALRRIYDEFSMDAMVRRYSDVYTSVVESGARREGVCKCVRDRNSRAKSRRRILW